MSAERRILRLFLAVNTLLAANLAAAQSQRADTDPSGMNKGRAPAEAPCEIEGLIKDIPVGKDTVSSTYLDLKGAPINPPQGGAIFTVPLVKAIANGGITDIPPGLSPDNTSAFCNYEILEAMYAKAKPGKYADASVEAPLQGDGGPEPEAVVAQLSVEVDSGVTLNPQMVEVNIKEDSQVAQILGLLSVDNPAAVARVIEVIPDTQHQWRKRVISVIYDNGVNSWIGWDRTQENLTYHILVDPENIEKFFGLQTKLIAQQATNIRVDTSTTQSPIGTVNEGESVTPIREAGESEGFNWYEIEKSDGTRGFIADANHDGIFGTTVRTLNYYDALIPVDADDPRYAQAYQSLPDDLKLQADRDELRFIETQNGFVNPEGKTWRIGLEGGYWVREIFRDTAGNTSFIYEAPDGYFEEMQIPVLTGFNEQFKRGFGPWQEDYLGNEASGRTFRVVLVPVAERIRNYEPYLVPYRFNNLANGGPMVVSGAAGSVPLPNGEVEILAFAYPGHKIWPNKSSSERIYGSYWQISDATLSGLIVWYLQNHNINADMSTLQRWGGSKKYNEILSNDGSWQRPHFFASPAN